MRGSRVSEANVRRRTSLSFKRTNVDTRTDPALEPGAALVGLQGAGIAAMIDSGAAFTQGVGVGGPPVVGQWGQQRVLTEQAEGDGIAREERPPRAAAEQAEAG